MVWGHHGVRESQKRKKPGAPQRPSRIDKAATHAKPIRDCLAGGGKGSTIRPQTGERTRKGRPGNENQGTFWGGGPVRKKGAQNYLKREDKRGKKQKKTSPRGRSMIILPSTGLSGEDNKGVRLLQFFLAFSKNRVQGEMEYEAQLQIFISDPRAQQNSVIESYKTEDERREGINCGGEVKENGESLLVRDG